MAYWLMKSEPSTYSIEDLQQEQVTIWDGVRNYQARNFLQQMKVGDLAFFYHSNCNPPGIVGLVEITATNVIDPTQFNPGNNYFDPKSTAENPRWYTVKVKLKQVFNYTISLTLLKEKFTEEDLLVVKKGNRLSVLPVPEQTALQILATLVNGK